MKKIAKVIAAFWAILKNPWLLNNILAQDEVWKEKLNQAYPNTNSLPVIEFQQFLKDNKEILPTFSFLDGGSMITDLVLLRSICQQFTDCTYFEIGTWRGESVANVADVCKECYTLCLPDDKMKDLGLSQDYINSHTFFSKSLANVHQLRSDSLSFNYKKLNKKFDVIFIDGNHDYEHVKQDTQLIFEHLVHEKSIVIWHDYAYSPEKVRSEVFKGILDGTPQQFHSNLYQISNTKCCVFTRKSYPSSQLKTYAQPNKSFKLDLHVEPIKS